VKVTNYEEGEIPEPSKTEEAPEEEECSMRASYVEVDRRSNLKEILEGCVVHEYPTLYIVVPK